MEEDRRLCENTETEKGYSEKNSKINKVMKLQQEIQRQNDLEKLRERRIMQQQEYIDKLLHSVEVTMKSTETERQFNEQFEEQVRGQIYQMHGISQDKLEGMQEARRAWYQGAAFSLFFLSLVLFGISGILDGFGSGLNLFIAFYTAIEGTLLTNERKQNAGLNIVVKVLYLLLFPVMLGMFVCAQLGYPEYELCLPYFTTGGVLVLMLGAVFYFIYDPYRLDRKSKRKADKYILGMEKAALKDIQLQDKAAKKAARQQEKEDTRTRKEQEKQDARTARDREREEVRSAKKQARTDAKALRAREKQEKSLERKEKWQEICEAIRTWWNRLWKKAQKEQARDILPEEKGSGVLAEMDAEEKGSSVLAEMDAEEKGSSVLAEMEAEEKGNNMLARTDAEEKGSSVLAKMDAEENGSKLTETEEESEIKKQPKAEAEEKEIK